MYCDRLEKGLINPKPKIKIKKISSSITYINADNSIGFVSADIGIIQAIKQKKITIKVRGGYSKHLHESSYHIFIKRKRSKQNDRDFYKALLNAL